MKKLVILVVFICMVGVFTIGCGVKDGKDVSANPQSSYKAEQLKAETNSAVVEEVNEQANEEAANEEQENKAAVSGKQESTEAAEQAGGAERVLSSFFEALIAQDTEKAREYMLYDDLGFPYKLEDGLDFYKKLMSQDIIGIEIISEDMQLIHVNMKTSEEELEDSYLLKVVDGSWCVAAGGIVARQQSVYSEQQVSDGEVGIYLQDIYHSFNGVDTYVINVVNNTSEILRIGFVNNGAIIYENDEGKEYVDLETTLELNPYNSGEIYFTANASQGPVKSITLKEVMLGLQPQTSDVEVLMGEMAAN